MRLDTLRTRVAGEGLQTFAGRSWPDELSRFYSLRDAVRPGPFFKGNDVADEIDSLRERELQRAVGDWLNHLTSDWGTFDWSAVNEPVTQRCDALSVLINRGFVAIRYAVEMFDPTDADNDDRKAIVWLEVVGDAWLSDDAEFRKCVFDRYRAACKQPWKECPGGWMTPSYGKLTQCDDGLLWIAPKVRLKLTSKGNMIADEYAGDHPKRTIKRVFAEAVPERRLNTLIDPPDASHAPLETEDEATGLLDSSQPEIPASAGQKPFTDADLATLRKLLESFRAKCQKCQATLQGKAVYGGYGPDRLWREARDVLELIAARTGSGKPSSLDIVDDELRSVIRRVSEFVEKLLTETFSREVSDYGDNAIGLLGIVASQTKDNALHWLPEPVESENRVTAAAEDELESKKNGQQEPKPHFQEVNSGSVADNPSGQSSKNSNSSGHVWDGIALDCSRDYVRKFKASCQAQRRPQNLKEFVPEWCRKHPEKPHSDTLLKKLQKFRTTWDPERRFYAKKWRSALNE